MYPNKQYEEKNTLINYWYFIANTRILIIGIQKKKTNFRNNESLVFPDLCSREHCVKYVYIKITLTKLHNRTLHSFP